MVLIGLQSKLTMKITIDSHGMKISIKTYFLYKQKFESYVNYPKVKNKDGIVHTLWCFVSRILFEY